MTIQVTANSKLTQAFKLHPNVLDYIVSLNPHDFQRLYNPLMQKLMPPRISLARVAAMTNTPIMEILIRIHEIAQSPLSAKEVETLRQDILAETADPLPLNLAEIPDWVHDPIVAEVDLLAADERLDTDPIPAIFRVLNPTNVGEVVLVKHKWEPQPLYDVWALREIEHFAVQQGLDEWWIYLRKTK